jgi:hypothetical protein
VTKRIRCSKGKTALAAVALLAVLLPAGAQASPETLSRSVSNMIFAPLDLLTAPVTAGMMVYNGLIDIDDTTGVRVAYTIPGYLWATGTNMGASLLRLTTGLIEFVPGVLLYPFETDMEPIMDPIEDGEGLVDEELPFMNVKFGINFQRAAY